jgi:hypothetical protein
VLPLDPGNTRRLTRSSDGLNIRPNPFKCRITPRNEEIKATIEREGREALDNLSIYNGETKFRISTYHLENK